MKSYHVSLAVQDIKMMLETKNVVIVFEVYFKENECVC